MTDTDQGNLSTDESITSSDQQLENLRSESTISDKIIGTGHATANTLSLNSNLIQTQGENQNYNNSLIDRCNL